MALNPALIHIASAPPNALVRIKGRAAVERARDFDLAVHKLTASGVSDVYIELGECPLLDSTFAGTLAQLAEEAAESKADVRYILLHAKPRIVDALANLEVLPLLRVAEGDDGCPIAGPGDELPLGNASHQEMGRFCLEAHRALMRRSEANRDRFAGVEAALTAELEKGEAR